MKIIGIDLGTSNSAAAVVREGKVEMIPTRQVSLSGKGFPSYVSFEAEKGKWLVGEPAKAQALLHPERTASGFKRKMGSGETIEVDGSSLTADVLSAEILKKIKDDAEAFLGEPPAAAVITVPAYFNFNQRQDVFNAASLCGLKVARLINEPTAAALAYGINKGGKAQKIMVFDLGAGTLDVTCMYMAADGVFEVLSTSGDTNLGGLDMDEAIVKWLAKEFKERTGADFTVDPEAVRRVRTEAEKAKIALSEVEEYLISIPYLSKGHHMEIRIDQLQLEDILEPVLEKCKKPVDQAMKDAKFELPQDYILLTVGGPTKMPCMKHFFAVWLAKEPESAADPMTAVAQGAALQAELLSSGNAKDILLLDVTALALGIKTAGDEMNVLVERNTSVPAEKTKIFTTTYDNQTAVDICVLQGASSKASENTQLGMFTLSDIAKAPKGTPTIEVKFCIDVNGMIEVTAKDQKTGRAQSIKIKYTTDKKTV